MRLSACHVILRVLDPCVLSYMPTHNVVSTVCPALVGGAAVPRGLRAAVGAATAGGVKRGEVAKKGPVAAGASDGGGQYPRRRRRQRARINIIQSLRHTPRMSYSEYSTSIRPPCLLYGTKEHLPFNTA